MRPLIRPVMRGILKSASQVYGGPSVLGIASVTTTGPEDVWLGETRTFVFTSNRAVESDTNIQFHMVTDSGLEEFDAVLLSGQSSVEWESPPLLGRGSGTGIVFTSADTTANAPFSTPPAFYPFSSPNNYTLFSASADPTTINSGDSVTYTLTLDHAMALAAPDSLDFMLFPPEVEPVTLPATWVQGESELVIETTVTGGAGVVSNALTGSAEWYGGGDTSGSFITINP